MSENSIKGIKKCAECGKETTDPTWVLQYCDPCIERYKEERITASFTVKVSVDLAKPWELQGVPDALYIEKLGEKIKQGVEDALDYQRENEYFNFGDITDASYEVPVCNGDGDFYYAVEMS